MTSRRAVDAGFPARVMMPRRRCPKCGEATVAEIIRGFPGPKAERLVAEGRAVLGGCMVGAGNEPDRACTSCGHEWEHEARRKA
jgi:predicted RNA-binding Zn-ribbon protein involved in translation (DUF1610 family)